MAFSELTRERFHRFKKIRRAHYSLWILVVFLGFSLFSELISNDKPLYLSYQGKSFFPVFRFYPGNAFGGPYQTEADYLELKQDPEFEKNQGWMVFPLIPHHPNHPYLDEPGNPPHPPSMKHWLGTDSAARDVLSRLLYGFRTCMLFSIALTLMGTILGVILGGIQGYWGGKTDMIIQRFTEIWSSLPFLYIVLLMGSIYGQSIGLLIIVMALFNWIGLSYYVRAEFLKLKNMVYIQSAKAIGLSTSKIFFRHILPNALPPLITILPFSLIGGISAITGLDF